MARRFGDRTSTLHQAHGSVFTMCEVADAEPSSLAAWAGSSVMRNQAQDAKKQLFQGLAFWIVLDVYNELSAIARGLTFLN